METTTRKPSLADRIEKAVREWPGWSRAECRRMDDIVEEILSHCRNGNGNRFVREWCERYLGNVQPN